MSFEEGFVQTYSDITPLDAPAAEDTPATAPEEVERTPLYNVNHTNTDTEIDTIYEDEVDPTLDQVAPTEIVEEISDEELEALPTSHWEDTASVRGWKPEENYDGDPADWRTAREFVEKGELFDVIHTLKRDAAVTKEALKGQSALIEQAVEHGKKQVIDSLKAKRSEARDQGEFDQADELSDKIAELKAAKATAPDGSEDVQDTTVVPPVARITPVERAAWVAKNAWFNTDTVAHQSSIILSESYLAANPAASGAEILNYVDKTMRDTRPDLYRNAAKSKPQAVARSSRTVAKPRSAESKLPVYSQLKREHQRQADLYHQSTKLPKSQWIKDFAAVGGFEEYNK